MNVTLDSYTIPLDDATAEQVKNDKKVIGGKKPSGFGLLPLKYPWAWEIYSNMRANQ